MQVPGSHQCLSIRIRIQVSTYAGSREPPMPVFVDPDPGSHLCGIQGAINAYICVDPDPDQAELRHFLLYNE
jgi:hypothetical protein